VQRYEPYFYLQTFFTKVLKYFSGQPLTLSISSLLSRRDCKDTSCFLFTKLFWKKITRIFCPSILQPPHQCSYEQHCRCKGRSIYISRQINLDIFLNYYSNSIGNNGDKQQQYSYNIESLQIALQAFNIWVAR
jgi:hypothetical protein